MEVVDFKKDLSERCGISLDDNYIIFNDYELYNQETDESIIFKSFEEVLDYKVADKTVKEIIEEKENTIEEDEGGRGASLSIKRGSLFGQTRVRGKRVISANANGNSMPSYMNTLVSAKSRSVDSIAKAFGKRTLNETR